MNNQIKELVLSSIMISLVFIFGLIPQLGYISLIPGILTITTTHVIVLVGVLALPSIFEGTNYRKVRYYLYPIALGLSFGLTSLIQSYVNGVTPFDIAFRNPLISVLPRVLFAFTAMIIFGGIKKLTDAAKEQKLVNFVIFASILMAGVVGGVYAFSVSFRLSIGWSLFVGVVIFAGALVGYYFLVRHIESQYVYIGVSMLISTIIHTILVLSILSIFGRGLYVDYLGGYNFSTFWTFLTSTLFTGGMIEALLALVVGTPVAIVIKKYLFRSTPVIEENEENI
jgi:hypothetical protein